jgi:hypothetical protein
MKTHLKLVTAISGERRLPGSRRRQFADDIRIALAHIRFLRLVRGKLPGTTKKPA